MKIPGNLPTISNVLPHALLIILLLRAGIHPNPGPTIANYNLGAGNTTKRKLAAALRKAIHEGAGIVAFTEFRCAQ